MSCKFTHQVSFHSSTFSVNCRNEEFFGLGFCYDHAPKSSIAELASSLVTTNSSLEYKLHTVEMVCKKGGFSTNIEEAVRKMVMERLIHMRLLQNYMELLNELLEWIPEEGCDCGEDAPGSCVICRAKHIRVGPSHVTEHSP